VEKGVRADQKVREKELRRSAAGESARPPDGRDNRSLQESPKARGEGERRPGTPGSESRGQDTRPTPESAARGRGNRSSRESGRDVSDLERRMDRLEQQLNKVIEVLERSNSPAKR
jgi:hypothetical protein